MTKQTSLGENNQTDVSVHWPPEADALLSRSSGYLASWKEDARRALVQTVETVAPRLDAWARRYPEVDRRRVLPLTLSVAAAAPFSEPRAIESTARMSLWVFTLDDIFDEQRYPADELVQRAMQYQAIAIGSVEASGGDPMSAALQEVRDDLASYPLFGPLEERWATAVCQTVQGMLVEQQWNEAYRRDGVSALPSYEEYTENGLLSIGGPPHVWSALVTIGDEATPDHFAHLHTMERTACTCIRLANDLQSAEKEDAEGKVNSLSILSREYGLTTTASAAASELARVRVLRDIAVGLARLVPLARAPFTATGKPERAIADIARFVCEFYSRHDFHTFTRKDAQTRQTAVAQW